ncbi:MAG: EF-hand domain-containing protein [Candidatus Sericytochromatia bacterium]|nr:EF-hand domain-containing protein [Candidatus Tanganyikabacteria bacterium]
MKPIGLSLGAYLRGEGTGTPARRPIDLAARRRGVDRDGDGDVSRRESRDRFTRSNSFATLDKDRDGLLSTLEMRDLERFDNRQYDTDGDGQVGRDEFVANRAAEMKANRRALVGQRIAAMDGDKLRAALDRFDADGDGRLSAAEVIGGRRELRRQEDAARRETAFEALAGDRGAFALESKQARIFAAYDADRDGRVGRAEFGEGHQADLQAVARSRYTGESPDSTVVNRLALDRLEPGTKEDEKQVSPGRPVDVGSLRDLTWDEAVNIIRSRGGELFENGRPAVLAVRTANAGTTTYDDAFVVLKPDGGMKTFAATTRPGFTTPGGGWDPAMVLPGNYEITPRWRDGKFNNDAFIIGTDDGWNVKAAEDRNGDGRYSRAELNRPVSSDEIRLHRGNDTTTSSAGCFNVQDYDGFLAYMGGRDVSFNMTLVNA